MAGVTGKQVAALAELGGGAKLGLRFALTLGLAVLFVWALIQRLEGVDLAQAQITLQQVAWPQWAAAAALTGLAFWAVGQYDAVLHCHFATQVDLRRARRAGICAIAVSQTMGLGVITGAVLRWRMMPEHSLAMATRITFAVALSFLAGWAVVTAVVLMVLPHAPYREVAALVLIAAAALALMCLIAPTAGFRWPNAMTMTKLVFFCGLDMAAAALGLYVLLPAGINIEFVLLLPAFLLAYGAGLVSGAPGGIGAFEVTLLALLPSADPGLMVAAVLGWRLMYFVVPAILAAGMAMRGVRPVAALAPSVALTLPTSGRPAETGIHAQGEHDLIGHNGRAEWLVARRAHVLVALFDPFAGCGTDALDHLAQIARAEARLPVVYKASARMAARAKGWLRLRCASEAVLDPRDFDLNHPRRAGLRRKLRRAAAVDICHIDPIQHFADLTQVADEWAHRHGGERGFSIGRFGRDYLAGQRVYIARSGGRAVGFISLHCCGGEWVLDMMRHGAADGTIHALVHRAIIDAKAAGIARFSLAAVPQIAFWRLPPWLGRFDLVGRGLRQFKDSFAPRWEGRYVLAPHWPAALIAAGSIALAVNRPGAKLWRYGKYRFAQRLVAWQSKEERFL